jgi:hypothetical protein
MNEIEAAGVLAKAAAFDRRKVGDAEILAWREALADLDVRDCLDAVTAHYRESSEWLSPAHVRRHAVRTRNVRFDERQRQARQLALSPGAPAERPAEVDRLIGKLAAEFSDPDLHQRAQQRARRERGRAPTELTRRPRTSDRRRKPADHPPPADGQIANHARRYLLDGHSPADVADWLGVSRAWCHKAARSMNASADAAADVLARQLRRQLNPDTEPEPATREDRP